MSKLLILLALFSAQAKEPSITFGDLPEGFTFLCEDGSQQKEPCNDNITPKEHTKNKPPKRSKKTYKPKFYPSITLKLKYGEIGLNSQHVYGYLYGRDYRISPIVGAKSDLSYSAGIRLNSKYIESRLGYNLLNIRLKYKRAYVGYSKGNVITIGYTIRY